MQSSIQVQGPPDEMDNPARQLEEMGFSVTPAAPDNQAALADYISFRDRWTKEEWEAWNARWNDEEWELWEAEKLAAKWDGESYESFKAGWWNPSDWKVYWRERQRRGLGPDPWQIQRQQEQGARSGVDDESSSSSNPRRRPASFMAEGDRRRIRAQGPGGAPPAAGASQRDTESPQP